MILPKKNQTFRSGIKIKTLTLWDTPRVQGLKKRERSSQERLEYERDGQGHLGDMLALLAHAQINKAQTVALDMNGVLLGTARKTYCHKPRDSHSPSELEILFRSSKDPKEKFYV